MFKEPRNEELILRMCLGTMIRSSKMGTKLIKIRREAERSDGGGGRVSAYELSQMGKLRPKGSKGTCPRLRSQ